MRGAFESRRGERLVAREAFALGEAGGAQTLRARGEGVEASDPSWTLDLAFARPDEPASLEVQVRPKDRPSEVTTAAFRCFGGRAFGTVIPPGGVPEKLETSFPRGSAFRGFSTALDGLAFSLPEAKVGHGRRLLVIELAPPALRPRIAEELLLATARERRRTARGDEWCMTYEFRAAESPGRAETTLVVTKAGLVLESRRADPEGTVVTRLAEVQP